MTTAVLAAALIALGAGCSDESKGAMKSPEETRKEEKPKIEPKPEPLPEIPPAKEPEPTKPAEPPPAEEPAPAQPPAEEKPAEPPAEPPKDPLPAEADVVYHCDSCGKDQTLAATAATPTCCGNPMKAKP